MATTDHEKLKEMASGAGLRLVKSRKRKAGVGDYGRYGLTTLAGQPCFGIAEDGSLTATPEELDTYLRDRARSRWKQSASTAKAIKPARQRRARTSDDPGQLPKRKPSSRPSSPSTRPKTRAAPPEKVEAETGNVVTAEAVPKRELTIRKAIGSDAPAIAALIEQSGLDPPPDEIARALRDLISNHEPPLIADLGGVVGCVACHAIPTLQHGIVGRITLLIVKEERRREGIGTALMLEAEKRLGEQGCTGLEIANEISLRNATGFLRSLRYENRAYLHFKDAPR